MFEQTKLSLTTLKLLWKENAQDAVCLFDLHRNLFTDLNALSLQQRADRQAFFLELRNKAMTIIRVRKEVLHLLGCYAVEEALFPEKSC